MTIFVGPNNSGKSLILRELENVVRSGTGGQARGTIIDHIDRKTLGEQEVLKLLVDESHLLPPNITVEEATGGFNISDPIRGTGGGYADLLRQPENIRHNLDGISQILITNSTVRLDGHTRLNLLLPIQATDLQQPPVGILGGLFKNVSALERLRQFTYEAFGLYFTIDPTGMQQFRAKMSGVPPQGQERLLSSESIEFFRRAADINDFSDGVKAFTGLLAAVLCSQYLVVLIDEPEAFLHPPLVRKLGRRLTEIASERGGSVLASTHSADFVMGSIQAGKSVNLVRLTYKQGVPTARLLASSKVEEMMRNPFLRSSGVLSALFHDGAIVCEADTDRAFYQEVNERLIAFDNGGVTNGVFLNSNGKDALRFIVQPLREMGIPAAAIVDLDVIKPGTLKPLLQAAFVPPPLASTLNGMKDQIFAAFQRAGLEPKKVGIAALDRVNQEAAAALISYLSEYGIFVVPPGEVEKWLPEAGSSGHGPRWLNQVFTWMGADPKAAGYVKPQEGDVWSFIVGIARWIINPERKGMPEYNLNSRCL
jgi:hypothetical protein